MLIMEYQLRNVIKLLLTEDLGKNNAMAIVMSLRIVSQNSEMMRALVSGHGQYIFEDLFKMLDPICRSYGADTEEVIYELMKTLEKQ